MLALLLACAPADSVVVTGPSETEASEEDKEEAEEETEVPEPEWSVTWGPIPEDLAAQMRGTTMHDAYGCKTLMRWTLHDDA